MSISTYSELKSAAASWLIRSDLTARIPEFIALAEARLNRVLRARLAETEATLTLAAAARTISLPAAYSEPLRVWIVLDGERVELAFREPSLFAASSLQGQPQIWTIDGASLAFERPADQAYSIVLRHLAKYALSDSVTTNTLLTNAPDIYLFATLCEAAPMLRDAALATAYESRLTRAIGEFNAKESRSKAQATLPSEFAAIQRLARGGGYNINTDR